jgi:hypothetical protein
MTKKNMSGIYTWQRKRVENSVSLVKRAIDELLAGKLRISLTTIVQASRKIDPAGRGVSASTILRNKQCYALYEKSSVQKKDNQKKSSSLSAVLDDPTASELRRAYLLAGKSKIILIAAIVLLERELKTSETQNSNLREKILSLLLPEPANRSS